MISETARVSEKGFFITTPNRWFPIEVHTTLPLVHWLPKPIFRKLLHVMGMQFFSLEKNLNLLGSSSLISAAKQADIGSRFDFYVHGVWLFGWVSNLILIGKRK